MPTKKTQGTELYVLNTADSPVAVLKIAGATNIGNLGGDASKIDTTTLDDLKYKTNRAGLIDPADADLGFYLDFTSEGQQFLREHVGESFKFAIGYYEDAADYGTPPTVNGSEDDFELPTTRSFSTFEASICRDTRSFDMDSVVKFGSALRLSGGITDTPATT